MLVLPFVFSLRCTASDFSPLGFKHTMKFSTLCAIAAASLTAAEEAGKKPRLTSEKLQKQIKPKK